MSREVHSCTHWLRPRDSSPPPAFGLVLRGCLLVSKDRRHLFVTPCYWPMQLTIWVRDSRETQYRLHWKRHRMNNFKEAHRVDIALAQATPPVSKHRQDATCLFPLLFFLLSQSVAGSILPGFAGWRADKYSSTASTWITLFIVHTNHIYFVFISISSNFFCFRS